MSRDLNLMVDGAGDWLTTFLATQHRDSQGSGRLDPHTTAHSHLQVGAVDSGTLPCTGPRAGDGAKLPSSALPLVGVWRLRDTSPAVLLVPPAL